MNQQSRWWSALGLGLLTFAAAWGFGWPDPSSLFASGGPHSTAAVDLTVRSLVRRDAIAESWEYEAVIVNQGDQAAGPFGVTFEGFECGNARGDTGVGWRDAYSVTRIVASGQVTATWNTGFGCRWARVTADMNRDTPDADRTDNTLDVWFRRFPETYEIGTLGLTRDGDERLWRAPLGGRQTGLGYFGDFWYVSGSTSRMRAETHGVWSVSLPPGVYRLFAFVPKHGELGGQRKPDAPSAVYQVYDQSGRWRDAVTIDQERFADTWVPLGAFAMNWHSKVRLGDNVGAPTTGGVWVVFDTIRAISE